MIKLLLLILLGFVLYSFFLALLRPAPGVSAKKHQKKQMTGETMVEDPVCGTCLPQADAVKTRIHGNDYYFCSKNCLERFKDSKDDDNDSSNL